MVLDEALQSANEKDLEALFTQKYSEICENKMLNASVERVVCCSIRSWKMVNDMCIINKND